jgi:hypothetical protein
MGASGGITSSSTLNNGHVRAIVSSLNPDHDAALENSLEEMYAKSPIARIEINRASENMVHIHVHDFGDPNKHGCYIPESATPTAEFPELNSVYVADPHNINTLAHELGHSITPENNDSQKEEVVNRILGAVVESQVTGKPMGDPKSIIATGYKDYGNNPNLPKDNGILDTYQNMGINLKPYFQSANMMA